MTQQKPTMIEMNKKECRIKQKKKHKMLGLELIELLLNSVYSVFDCSQL